MFPPCSDGIKIYRSTFFRDKLGINIEKRISPKKGKVVIFDGMRSHASSPLQEAKARSVINANILCPFSANDIGQFT